MRGWILVVALLVMMPAGSSAPTGQADAAEPSDAASMSSAHDVGSLAVPAGAQDGALPGADADSSADAWIWQGPPAAVADALAWLASQGITHHHYPRLDMVSLYATPAGADDLVNAVGGRVERNEAMRLHLDKTVAYIEADLVKRTLGMRRDGPSVMVIDTGVDSLHPDFRMGENLAANIQADRQGGLVSGVLQNQPVLDPAGHGTHVAGIVAGLGQGLSARDANRDKYVGVYSIGRIIGFKAATETSGEIMVDTVAALEAFDWALANQERYDIRVITNSWGNPGNLDENNAVNQATLRLYLNGMTVVFSAGNEGEKGPGTLNKYCQAPWVLCVAAGDLAGGRASFSSYGDPKSGRPYDHPDITAPGFQVHSANPPSRTDLVGGVLAGNPDLYRIRSGTSMAAPHVAGVAALIQAANGALSPDQVMDILVATTDPMLDPEYKVGSGYLNARQAYNLAVQTPGNRAAFLAGDEVKYAGPQSGDLLYARDPVSVGYGDPVGGGPLQARQAPAFVTDQPIAFAVLLGLALVALVVGIRWRR
jgi:serine protease AprX